MHDFIIAGALVVCVDSCPSISLTMYYILDKEEEQKEEGDGEQRCLGRVAYVVLFPYVHNLPVSLIL